MNDVNHKNGYTGEHYRKINGPKGDYFEYGYTTISGENFSVTCKTLTGCRNLRDFWVRSLEVKHD